MVSLFETVASTQQGTQERLSDIQQRIRGHEEEAAEAAGMLGG